MSPEGALLHREHNLAGLWRVYDISEGKVNVGELLPLRLVRRDDNLETIANTWRGRLGHKPKGRGRVFVENYEPRHGKHHAYYSRTAHIPISRNDQTLDDGFWSLGMPVDGRVVAGTTQERSTEIAKAVGTSEEEGRRLHNGKRR